MGKQERSPKALRALVQDTRTYTVTHGQLTQTHMSRHMQLHSCLAYQHTRHSRIQLRAQQVFTPQDLLCRPAARCTQRERMACWGTTPPSTPQRHTVPLPQPPYITQNKRQRAVSQNKQLKQTGNIQARSASRKMRRMKVVENGQQHSLTPRLTTYFADISHVLTNALHTRE